MSKDKEIFLKELRKEGISKATMDAFSAVDQELFFPKSVGMKHYEIKHLPVGCGERSDDPLLLARMIDILAPKKTWRLLEVGGGSGYSTAILSTMVKEVVSVEYNEQLAKLARERLIDNGYFNVRSFTGDATEMGDGLGLFDGIIILASCMQRPLRLLAMLKNNHYAVFPMGPAFQQQIVRYKNTPMGEEDTLPNFTFYDFCNVPSIRGIYGWVDQVELPPEAENRSPGENDEEQNDQKRKK